MVDIAGIIILGIAAQWIAWKTRVPAILPLIIIGLAVGPLSTLISEDGSKWIEPLYEEDGSKKGLFPGESLFWFVSLAIGVILFEGGLTLKRAELKGIGPAIVKLISIGSAITFIGGGMIAHWLLDLAWQVSFLFAALIIVTGPTVIAPILRNVPLNRNVSAVLKWEGILIDPIGALVAVLVFEFIRSGLEGGEYGVHALGQFGKIVVLGFSIGFAAAHFLYQLIRRRLIPHYLLNVFTLALVLAVFALSDTLAHESGLLTVVIMGMVLGNLDTPYLKDILDFKESMSVLLISILFILLSANIDLADLKLLLNWNCLYLFLAVVFLLRPLGVFLSTGKSNLNVREKTFISWVGPRGIVAAGIASLFGLKLVDDNVPGAELITPLVFMIVLGTVLLNATTARLFAKWLGVIQTSSHGILIIGANNPARLIAKYLDKENRHVVLIDSNYSNVKKANEVGLTAMQVNIYVDDLDDKIELLDMGYLMAMTGSNDVNKYACEKFEKDFGELGTFRLISSDELNAPIDKLPEAGLFSRTDDYINLSEVARDFPQIHEMPLEGQKDFLEKIKDFHKIKAQIPLFVKNSDGILEIIPADPNLLEVEKGWKLVYMGKEAEKETLKQEEEATPA